MAKGGNFMCPNSWGGQSAVEGSGQQLFEGMIEFVGETGPKISSPIDKGVRPRGDVSCPRSHSESMSEWD